MSQESSPPPTFDTRYFVRATGLGNWPGTDMVDALNRVRGELGAPHLPFLPIQTERGYAASTLARTIACLDGLDADGASFGWRIVNGFSREGQKARSLFASDLNALADTVGKESGSGHAFKLQLTGPITLAASLYLPNGERAISDSGAVRDIRDSLIAGLEPWLRLLQEAVPGESIVIQWNESALESALRGTIKTASGFRTHRAIPVQTLEESYELLASELKSQNVELAINSVPFDYLKKLTFVAQASTISLEHLTEYDWEKIAWLVESNQQVWLGAVSLNQRKPLVEQAFHLWKTWRNIGLPASALSQVTLTEDGDLSQLSPTQATAVLGDLTELARALSEIAQDN